MRLAKSVGRDMAARNEGRALVASSIASMMPGPTETDFFHRDGMDDTRSGRQDRGDPAQVARHPLDALFSGKGKTVAGSAGTEAQGLAGRVFPDKLKREAHRKTAEPCSGDQD
ncbi:hypothetical protein [Streptomyces sp. NPDC014623]|uniref:hypothetical protein n=1 Tax=Streptomyces sp. NPDC014623 TaxID=3364875 RepID=UPI0036F67B8C